MEKQEYRYTTLWKAEEETILFANYTPQLEIDITVARELVENRMAFANNAPHYILIDFTNVKSVTKEAKDYMNDPLGGLKGLLGGAFLTNNVVAKVFINLFLKINKPTIPAKFFTNKEDALKWLRELKAKSRYN
jgi:hypothetical protein